MLFRPRGPSSGAGSGTGGGGGASGGGKRVRVYRRVKPATPASDTPKIFSKPGSVPGKVTPASDIHGELLRFLGNVVPIRPADIIVPDILQLVTEEYVAVSYPASQETPPQLVDAHLLWELFISSEQMEEEDEEILVTLHAIEP